MNGGLAGIIFANIVLAVLLATLIVRTRWAWVIKAAAALCVVLLYYSTIESYPSFAGWPTSVDLPNRFNFLGAIFEEPNKSTQTKGKIYLWVTDMHAMDNRTPRAYVIPYTASLHETVYDASQKLRKQLSQLGEVVMTRNPVTAKEEISLQFFDMPEVLLPK